MAWFGKHWPAARRHRAAKSCARERSTYPRARTPSIERLEARRLLVSDVLINEMMASNDTTLVDEDGDSSDWIEIRNTSADPVSLEHWYLTDDASQLQQWEFPSVTLPGDGFLVVFASGKDRSGVGGELHTNFKLSRDGEYVGLVGPEGVVAHDLGESYPVQIADVSYGIASGGSETGYLATATPGASNSELQGGVVGFDRASGVFSTPFLLELSTEAPAARIHYTTDGSVPDASSSEYTSPIPINATTHVRAVSVLGDGPPGVAASRWYVRLDASMADASSNLPVLVLENFNEGRPPESSFQFNGLALYEPDASTGRTSFAGDPALEIRTGLRVRGSSTSGQPKPSYALETWDALNQDTDVPLLGLPADSDWVLFSPYNFDRSLIRNSLIYELSNQIGRYAVRTRFVEMYHNWDGGDLSEGDYRGIYVLMEKIKRGPDRVDIEPLETDPINAPEVNGGWLLKIDRADPGDQGFEAGGRRLLYVDPKESEVTARQAEYITQQIDAMAASLTDTDPETGYARYIDVDSWIDHHLLNVLTKNPDGLRLSTYLFQDAGGKIEFGPIWDFDRSMGSEDGRDLDPLTWDSVGDGSNFFNYSWWDPLFQDPEFRRKWFDRWFELRDDVFTEENFNRIIDAMAAEIREAQDRNWERWPGIAPNGGMFAPDGMDSWEGELLHLKGWLAARLQWIDSQFSSPPTVVPGAGRHPVGQEILLAAEEGTIYYTLDGTDPRLPGGELHPNAIEFNQSISLVDGDSPAAYLLPSGGPQETGWQEIEFDDSAWSAGSASLGYDTGQFDDSVEVASGFTVHQVHSVSVINGLPAADAVLLGAAVESEATVTDVPYINYLGAGGDGNFAENLSFPDGAGENFALEATAALTVHAEGMYTFGVNSDDGSRLMIDGQIVVLDNRRHGPRDYFGSIYLTAGSHDLTLVYFQNTAGAELELSVADGMHSTFNDRFRLVGQQFNAPIDSFIDTDVQQAMHLQNAGAFVRIPFQARELPRIERMVLGMRYDDGFVAYLNGTEIARSNAPKQPRYDSTAAALRPDGAAVDVEKFNVSDSVHLLRNGENILAIHGVNVTPDSPDFLVHPELTVSLEGEPIVLAEPLDIFARTRVEDDWSAARRASILTTGTPDDFSGLLVSEINYHPHDPTAHELQIDPAREADDFEFIELTNTAQHVVDLTGLRFVDGVSFDFSDARIQSLEPGQSVLVVQDQAAMEARYGTGRPISGTFSSGRLDNAGERLRLVDADGNALLDMMWQDAAPWPERADGLGSTLELASATHELAAAESWRASVRYGGSPGTTAAEETSGILINEIWVGDAGPQDHRVELHNVSDHDVDLSGWRLTTDAEQPGQYVVPPSTSLAGKGYLVLNGDQTGLAIEGSSHNRLWLLESESGNPDSLLFADEAAFGPIDRDVAVGRWPDADRSAPLVTMREPTLGTPNAGPRMGPVILSELHYHPGDLPDTVLQFSDGESPALDPEAGNWMVSEGKYSLVPSAETNGDSLAVLRGVQPLTDRFSLSVDIELPEDVPGFSRNAAVVFDYQDPANFKFASVHLNANKWRIGLHDDTGWHFIDDIIQFPPLSLHEQPFEVRLEVDGTFARLRADGTAKVSYDFGTPLNKGLVGVGSKNGRAVFDNFKLQRFNADSFEFVELVNTSQATVDLGGWEISGDVLAALPAGAALEPHESLVVVGFDPTDEIRAREFRSLFDVDTLVPLIGPFARSLPDSNGVVQLTRPREAGPAQDIQVQVDQVAYSADLPWPEMADGQGASLNRKKADAFGPFARSWYPAMPTPGESKFVVNGDLNRDGAIDLEDIEPFILALKDPSAYQRMHGVAPVVIVDADADGDLDFDDIDGFLQLIQPAVSQSAALGIVLINEMMASNDTTLVDEDGDSSDWIEIRNTSADPVSLEHWYLTDDASQLQQWEFPSVTLPGDGFLVVFASGKDRSGVGGELHTNFKLSRDGEYVGLVGPEGVVAHDLGESYPVQIADVSYGIASGGSETGYLATATPGASNSELQGGVVGFDRASGVFSTPFLLELSTEAPAARIHYTTDGSVPDASSSEYTSPIPINATTHVRAVSVLGDGPPGVAASRWYVRLDASMADASSNLPVLVLENFNEGRPPESSFQFNGLALYEPDASTGRTSFAGDPALEIRTGLRVRGSSTSGQPKPSYALETWDALNQDTDVPLLGLPADSDWVLFSPYNFDRSLIRNSLIYELSNQIGRYAVRTRFVEMYHNWDGGDLSEGDYRGIYVLMEKIKRGPDRVDIEPLETDPINAPEVNGGWLLKIDRADPGDQGFEAGGRRLLYVDPKESEVTARQAEYITQQIDAMAASLTDTDPETGYARYIDVDSWIDHHLLNVLTKNPDGLRLSTYLFQDAGGKIEFGPIWDFDRSMGSEDGRDRHVNSWGGLGDDLPFANFPWWKELFDDPNFVRRWKDRWFELREHVFTDDNFNRIIDSMAQQIREAQARNQQRWPHVAPNGGDFAVLGQTDWDAEVDHLKGWLAARAAWIDSQFGIPPEISPAGCVVDGKTSFRIGPDGGIIYYTIDGTDPRGIDNLPTPHAVAYTPTATYVNASSTAQHLVPSGNPDLAGWETIGFDDDTWADGVSAIGYDTGIADGSLTLPAGFTVQHAHATSPVNSLVAADALLDGGPQIASETVVTGVEVINMSASVADGHYANDAQLPDGTAADSAIQVSATLVVHAEGTYTFGVRTGDGSRLRIDGQDVIADHVQHEPRDILGSVFLQQGSHSLELVTFDSQQDAVLELFFAYGVHADFNSAFKLLGRSDNVPLASLIGVDLASTMHQTASTAYLRIPFTVSERDRVLQLTLRMHYDDGFVAYLNGTEVARRHAPELPAADSVALTARADPAAVVAEDIDIGTFNSLLLEGGNVLAIQGLNVAADDADFLIVPELASVISGDPVVLDAPATVTARMLTDGQWSPPARAFFTSTAQADATNLAITEVNYHPHQANVPDGEPDVGRDEFEFVELLNTGPVPIDLEGVQLVESVFRDQRQGIRFTFDTQILDPGERIVVVENRSAFAARYGQDVRIADGRDQTGDANGEFGGKLDNQSDRLTLLDRFGRTIQIVDYDDRAPWPERADGRGSSWQRSPAGPGDGPDNSGRASVRYGGSPGFDEGDALQDVVINEVVGSADPAGTERVELFNTSSETIDVSGWRVGRASGSTSDYVIPPGTILGPGDHAALDLTAAGFSLPEQQPERWWLLAVDPASGSPQRFADEVVVHPVSGEASAGRVPAQQDEVLFPLADPSPGAANGAAAVPGLVISEIHREQPFAVVREDFSHEAGDLQPRLGDWQVAEGRYVVTPGEQGDTVALLESFIPPGDRWELAATLRTFDPTEGFGRNGALIFDYQDTENFKFVSSHIGASRWRMGQRDPDGWHFLEEAREFPDLESNTDYRMRLEVHGSLARLWVDGAVKLQHDFQTPLNTRMVGLGSKNGKAIFDDVVATVTEPGQFDFVEVFNTTAEPVVLAGWQLAGTAQFTFEDSTTIQPNQALTVVHFDPRDSSQADNFRNFFGLESATEFVGPFRVVPNGRSNEVTLVGPAVPTESPEARQLEDRVVVAPRLRGREAPFQPIASSHRRAAGAFGALGSSWIEGPPTPGQISFTLLGDMDKDGQIAPADAAALSLAIKRANDYEATYDQPAFAAGDIDLDGDLDFDDIDDFLNRLFGPSNPAAANGGLDHDYERANHAGLENRARNDASAAWSNSVDAALKTEPFWR